MKRNANLQPLSREHHLALLCWRELDRQLSAAGGGDHADLTVAIDGLREYWDDKFLAHMDCEETLLLDLLSDALRSRLLAEHSALRSHFYSVLQQLDSGEFDNDELVKLTTLWRAHIRWEERQLFPYLETHASTGDLASIGESLLGAHNSCRTHQPERKFK